MKQLNTSIKGGKNGDEAAMAGVETRIMRGAEIIASLPMLAALRIEVFREFPYLYEGDFEYERKYLESFAAAADAVVAGAFDDGRLVGAATAAPLAGEKAAWTKPLADAGFSLDRVFYFGESVLSRPYRGKGLGHRFFDLREEAARAQGKSATAFVSVIREQDHPGRPADYRPLDAFWRGRGYEKVEGAIAEFEWRMVGDTVETTHQLQYWAREL